MGEEAAMPNISLDAANQIFNASNIALIVGACLAVVGTFGAVYSSGVRDRYADERSKQNELKIANALSDAARANAEAAHANAQAALANERAASLDKEASRLKVELTDRSHPLVARTIKETQIQRLKAQLAGTALTIILLAPINDGESQIYADALQSTLASAGCIFDRRTGPNDKIGFWPVPPGLSLLNSDDPATQKLAVALKKAGIEFEAMQSSSFHPEFPLLLVGARRPLIN
jgi:hypothetical protein